MTILTVVVGSYEGSVYCFKVNLVHLNYNRHFSNQDSIGGVRSIQVSNTTAYIGSKDESIRIYNHAKKRSDGVLTSHTGTVFKIELTSQYLISGDDNANIMLWGNKNKALYHIIKTGKHGMLDFDVHPSEKMVISMGGAEGKFYILRQWDLANCKEIFQKKFQKRISLIKFVESGDIVLVNLMSVINLNIDTQEVENTLTCDSNINALVTYKNYQIALTESGNCYVQDVSNRNSLTNQNYFVFKALNNRGKNMHQSAASGEVYLTVISTEGDIKIFELSALLEKFPESANLPQIASDDQKPGNLILDMGIEFEAVYSITIQSRLLVVGTNLQIDETQSNPKVKSHTQKASSMIEAKMNSTGKNARKNYIMKKKVNINAKTFIKNWKNMSKLNPSSKIRRQQMWKKWNKKELNFVFE